MEKFYEKILIKKISKDISNITIVYLEEDDYFNFKGKKAYFGSRIKKDKNLINIFPEQIRDFITTDDEKQDYFRYYTKEQLLELWSCEFYDWFVVLKYKNKFKDILKKLFN